MFETLFFFVLIATAILGWLAYQGRKNAAHLRALSREKLDTLTGEHKKHVGRLQRKLVDANALGHLDFAADLLPVLDALDSAAAGLASHKNAPESTVDDGLRDGLKLVRRELDAVLDRHGIRRCNPEPDAPFDPNIHEAVAVIKDAEFDDVAPGHIVECLRPGYLHSRQVLRPATVSVKQNKPAGTRPQEF